MICNIPKINLGIFLAYLNILFMKSSIISLILFHFFFVGYAADIFSIKIFKEEKLAGDSLFFQLIDQQRAIQNDGVVKVDIFHAPSGYLEQKMVWMQDGICNQFVSFKGIKEGKLFIRASTTLGNIENSKSEFLVFVEQAKVVSVQDLYSNQLSALKVEVESGELLEGFSNKIAISTINTKTGKLQKEQVFITTENGDTLSRFTVGGKRLIELYVEQGKQYYLQTNTTAKPIELKGTSYGYGIKCNQVGDSIDIEVLRGKLEPVKQLHFCLQVNNKLDTIESFVFDDSLFVMNARLYWPPIINQHISFVLLNNSNGVLAKRYWEPDTELQKQSPFFTKLKTRTITIDSAFTMQFTCKGCDREKITYQVMDKDNVLSGVGQVKWLSDSVFAINDLQLVGKGYLALSVDRKNINWKPIIQSIALPIEKPTPIFYVKEDAKNILSTNNTADPKDMFKPDINDNLLPEVSVEGVRKTRVEELEQKYVKSIMFKSLFTIPINVLDDENARNGLTLLQYVNQKIPITKVKTVGSRFGGKREALIFRGSEVEYWIDEVFYDADAGGSLLKNIYAGDVAYIKLLKNPIRGMSSSSGGILMGGAPGPAGALVVYTKKGNEKELDKRYHQRVAIEGIEIFEF